MNLKMLKKKTLFFILLLTSNFAFAQLESHLIEGEGWIKGNYVEIGVNNKGVFGNNTANKPASFHDNREVGNFLFGFIANPQKDGWVDYDGDFFTPGSPEEGFSLEINGINYSNNNEIVGSGIPGSIIDAKTIESSCFEDSAQIQWEGEVEGLKINRYYSVTENNLFIQMITTVTNNTSEAKEDVFFMHNVDPDNNQTLSGSFDTNLHLISQPDDTEDVALVEASQEPLETVEDMDGSSVSFYAKDTRARVTYGGFTNRNASQVWNGSFDFINTEGSTTLADAAISIAFKLGTINPSETKTFVYYYILEEIDVDFIPVILNIFASSPTTCGGSEGKISLSGLTEGEACTVSYQRNGILVPEQDYIANSDGIVELTGLDAGTYSNFEIEIDGCTTFNNNVYQLINPGAPIFTLDFLNPDNCNGDNGEIIFNGLLSNEIISVSYELDGAAIPAMEYTSNASGVMTISNLKNGNYTNFEVTSNSTGCATETNELIALSGTFPFLIDTIPEQLFCDEDLDYITNINLETLNNIVLGTLDTAIYEVSDYYDSEENVVNEIPLNKINYSTTGVDSYNLYFKIRNKSTGCFETSSFPIRINIPASFSIEDQIVCLLSNDSIDNEYDLPNIDTDLNSLEYDFQWFLDDTDLGVNLPSITVSEQGLYKVIVTTKATGCSITKEVFVNPSGKPKMFDITILSGFFSDENTIQIDVTGFGNYVYRINDEAYQESSTFEEVPFGEHRFYVNDLNGCGEVMQTKTIIGYPKFFTPNGDGHNDYWQIIGIEQLIDSDISIFDRYGKLVKKLKPTDMGWDGYYNGVLMPNNDYWFVIHFRDPKGEAISFRAHFSLIR